MLGFVDSLKHSLVPIHKEGFPIIGVALVIELIFYLLSGTLARIGLVLICFIIYFFRNPKRFPTPIKEAIVSAADGTVDSVSDSKPPEELGLDESKKWIRISTFLDVFNVHSQRIPFDGVIKKVVYHHGKFVNVTLDKNSKDNERNSIVLETEDGDQIIFVQIAGLIARRIICNVKEGERVKKGDLYGLIRFGSRVDVYVPSETKILVQPGQTMVGGETILGFINKSK